MPSPIPSPILTETANQETCHPATSFSVQAKAQQIDSAREYCNTVKHAVGSNWTFQKMRFPISISLRFSNTTQKTVNWELKNITDNIIIDYGSWQHEGSEYTTFSKVVETTQNYSGKEIRLSVTASQSARIGLNLQIQVWHV